jgi:hypothetical protein
MKKTLGVLAGILLAMTACKNTGDRDRDRGTSSKPVERSTTPTTPDKSTTPTPAPTPDQGTSGSVGGGTSGSTMGQGTSQDQGTPQGAPGTSGDQGTAMNAPGQQGGVVSYTFEQKDQMASNMKSRLDAIDSKLTQLDAKSDESAKAQAKLLHQRRDQISRQVDSIPDQTQAGWTDFQKRVSNSVSKLEHDVDTATKSS